MLVLAMDMLMRPQHLSLACANVQGILDNVAF